MKNVCAQPWVWSELWEWEAVRRMGEKEERGRPTCWVDAYIGAYTHACSHDNPRVRTDRTSHLSWVNMEGARMETWMEWVVGASLLHDAIALLPTFSDICGAHTHYDKLSSPTSRSPQLQPFAENSCPGWCRLPVIARFWCSLESSPCSLVEIKLGFCNLYWYGEMVLC